MLAYLKSYEYRLFFLICFTIVGLVTSKSVMSIGVVAMFANILLDLVLYPKKFGSLFRNFFHQKKLFVFALVFFTSLLALSYSSNKTIGFQFVLNKISFLVIPFAFSVAKKISHKQFSFMLKFFVATIFVSALLVLINYFQNYDALNFGIKKGKAIWVPFNHIRYSVMLVFACLSSIYFVTQNNKKYALFALFFFLVIHLLSVRTGILVLYVSLGAATLFYFYQSKNFVLLAASILILTSTPYLAHKLIPSFKNKILYTTYDWQQFKKGNIGSNSDSRRMISYKAGFSILKNNMPFGVGTGSLQSETNKYYQTHYPNILERDRIAPHNQFLFTLLDCGVLGLLALLLALFYPLKGFRLNATSGLYFLFWLSASLPLLYDISLERQLGIIYFVLFSSLFIKKISFEEEPV